MPTWIQKLWSKTKYLPQRGGTPRYPVIEPLRPNDIFNTWMGTTAETAYGKIYTQSAWVYMAVNRIAEAGALVPLHILQRTGEKLLAVERHPLEVLLDFPNPFTSRFELFEQTLGSLELTGNAYWFLNGSDGVPHEIWVLPPERIQVIPSAETHIKGYIYEVNGMQIPLHPHEIIHFKRWNPNNSYYGLSALETARLSIQSDRAMAEWNRNTFGQDRGVPAGIVSIRDSISDVDYERIKREWHQSYGGVQRRTAFLRGGMIDWKHIGLSHQDLDFLKGRQAQRDEILNIFGIPIGLVDANATEANAVVAERMFIERTLYPKLMRISQKISQDLLPFWGYDLVAQFEDIRSTDQQARIADIQASYPLLSINEMRERFYNLAPVAWGDVPVGKPETAE